jgi:hypothetical protein
MISLVELIAVSSIARTSPIFSGPRTAAASSPCAPLPKSIRIATKVSSKSYGRSGVDRSPWIARALRFAVRGTIALLLAKTNSRGYYNGRVQGETTSRPRITLRPRRARAAGGFEPRAGRGRRGSGYGLGRHRQGCRSADRPSRARQRSATPSIPRPRIRPCTETPAPVGSSQRRGRHEATHRCSYLGSRRGSFGGNSERFVGCSLVL